MILILNFSSKISRQKTVLMWASVSNEISNIIKHYFRKVCHWPSWVFSSKYGLYLTISIYISNLCQYNIYKNKSQFITITHQLQSATSPHPLPGTITALVGFILSKIFSTIWSKALIQGVGVNFRNCLYVQKPTQEFQGSPLIWWKS